MKHFLFVLLFVGVTLCLMAQEKSKKEIRAEQKALLALKVDSLVANNQISFLARNAIPTGGESISLTSNYNLWIKGDTVQVFLPYYGRAYQASFGNSEGGIKFTAPMVNVSKTFKKGNHTISFEAKAPTDLYRMSLTVTQSGYCSLTVNSMNRSSIGFEGELENLGQ
jgi:hypothetical protein